MKRNNYIVHKNIYLKDDDGHEEWLKSNETYDKDDLEGSRKKLIEKNALVKIEIEGASFSEMNKYYEP